MELLQRIENYLALAHVSATRFGRQVAGDPGLVLDLRNGRRPRPGTARRIECYLARAEGRLAGRGNPVMIEVPP